MFSFWVYLFIAFILLIIGLAKKNAFLTVASILCIVLLLNGASDRKIQNDKKRFVVHVSDLQERGGNLYYRDTIVTLDKNTNPVLYMRCKEEIVLNKLGYHYYLYEKDNL